MDDQPGTSSNEIQLDGLVARYGRKLAQAELEAEVATQRANRAEAKANALTDRMSELEQRIEELEEATA